MVHLDLPNGKICMFVEETNSCCLNSSMLQKWSVAESQLFLLEVLKWWQKASCSYWKYWNGDRKPVVPIVSTEMVTESQLFLLKVLKWWQKASCSYWKYWNSDRKPVVPIESTEKIHVVFIAILKQTCICFISGVIPHIHKSLIGKKGSQKP